MRPSTHRCSMPWLINSLALAWIIVLIRAILSLILVESAEIKVKIIIWRLLIILLLLRGPKVFILLLIIVVLIIVVLIVILTAIAVLTSRILISILVHEVVSLSQIIVSIHKTLVIDPEFKLFTMLLEIKGMGSNMHIILHEISQGLFFVDDSAIPQQSLLSGHHWVLQFETISDAIQIKVPTSPGFRSIKMNKFLQKMFAQLTFEPALQYWYNKNWSA